MRKTPRRLLLTLAAVLLAVAPLSAQEDPFGGKYLPLEFSLQRHQVPDWFHDAKLGIFIHWGLYSVPGWATTSGELGKVDPKLWFSHNAYAEWYLNTLRIEGSPTQKRHVEKFGKDFDYYDFTKTFNKDVKKWNPDEWAKLFKQVGARYVVLTTKHHDGFTLWPSEVKNPHLPKGRQHASRDLVGELTKAVRAQGMKMGLYYSGGLDWSFNETPITQFPEVISTAPQDKEYAAYVDAHWRELIKKYQPAVLWNDITYPKNSEALQIFADYYNQYPEGVINNRWGSRPHDFTTPEYSKYDKIVDKKWESCRGLGYSFGYNQAEGPEQVLPADELVDLFVDIVSKNGNLLLNIGPQPDGTISQIQTDRLQALGEWLGTNGEAIFATRPWVTANGKTADGVDVRFTQKGDSVYAILLQKPKGSEITIEKFWPADGAKVELLGQAGTLQWERQGTDMKLSLPAKMPDSHAYALKITPKPWKLMRE